mmetsp:Transcript_101551/g.296000  ORF Transcript_101551/g.296000 Transcript_101551/m.296000 type:complete len:84 (-) Transcript_101551:13-264(-)
MQEWKKPATPAAAETTAAAAVTDTTQALGKRRLGQRPSGAGSCRHLQHAIEELGSAMGQGKVPCLCGRAHATAAGLCCKEALP